MGEFRTLYLDMDSFFASVEQHENPALRGRPVAITAVDGTNGACVAASYEAKAFGVKTGTLVRDAKRLCPEIVFLPSRHRLYVQYNLRIAAILDQMAELERIRSVDEFQLRLGGAASELDGAVALVKAMKQRIATEIGQSIRLSAGIGPNSLLAKIAGKLEKPDGCQWLSPRNMPQRLSHLKLDDLPGISKGVKAKLYKARVWDIEALYRLDPRHARLIWGSIEGERFVRALQGADIPLVTTERHGYGNSKVLAPDSRPISQAYLVGRWLVEKSASRLRRDGRVAKSFSLSVSFLPEGGASLRLRCEASQDTAYFLKLHRQLWEAIWRRHRPRQAISVSVQLGDVSLLADRAGDLFAPLRPAEKTTGEKVSELVDAVNARFGKDTLRWGENRPHHGFFERG
ncbi:DNA polymerase Y family protein [Pseudogemmobacter faecipullorum]|uniref:DNA-directed DNA polymerase n=1 Tax=Pseudogemmobacter faecipullorum TaxID=2755041 RepID=A0ABS8CQQ2_9RHOB|nr:UMUC-like DNA-repair protein [Pseudogemmobacter faecipullorum]MCB5411683.1 UMUC-like DNA-repair protein [Pseudogemmobacter faecipullorum]